MKHLVRFAPFTRFFSTKTRNYTEIKIPVPWGHVAAKWWGPGKSRPIVTVHGWQVEICKKVLLLFLILLFYCSNRITVEVLIL